MNPNANAILTLCSHLCVGDGVAPLEPKEYRELAQKLLSIGKEPGDLFAMSGGEIAEELNTDAERILRLLDRNASLCFALEQLNGMGIGTITRADSAYPKALKKKLSDHCPPIFYYAGDLNLLNRPTVGFVGARTVELQDMDFTKGAVGKVTSLGYGIVSGGAKGIDTIAGAEAMCRDAFAIAYLSDSMLKQLKSSDTVKKIQSGNLLLLSVVKPDAGFNVGTAMMRNRYIYAQSEGTVIVRADLNKGGTWAGAMENLKHEWCPTLCWDHPYPGNQALIEKGAIAIDASWDGRIPDMQKKEQKTEDVEQLSLFDDAGQGTVRTGDVRTGDGSPS